MMTRPLRPRRLNPEAHALPPVHTHTHTSTALERTLGFSLEHCLMKVWPNTDLFCGGSHGIPIDERLRVKRPYGRVDRVVRAFLLVMA